MMNTFKIKNLDIISKLLLFLIFFIIALFCYLALLNTHIEKFSANNDKVNELKIINKEFDNFLLKQAQFLDYNSINESSLKFDENMQFLISNISIKDKIYHKFLENISELYKQKSLRIEYFKSENAQLLYSMHYLFDLNLALSKSPTIKQTEKKTVNRTLLSLMKYYINPNINTQEILTNLQNLTLIHDSTIELFIEHTKINLKRIKKFNEIKSIQDKEGMLTALEQLHTYLHNEYDHNIFIEKSIIIVLFLIAIFILILLMKINSQSMSLRDELAGFKTAIENSYNSIVMTDAQHNITFINETAEKETGYTKEALIGQNPRILKSGLNDGKFYEELHYALNNGQKWEGEFVNRRKDGTLFYEKASIIPILQNGKISHYLAIKLNITDYIQEKNKVEYMAYHDSLTSLPNRLSIEMYLENRLPVAQRNKLEIAILFIDLDRFKTINDTLGHDVGDDLLIAASKRIKSALRESDLLARVGGDEFIIVIETSNVKEAAINVSEKILELFSTPIQTASHLLNITLSIGISIFPDHEEEDYKKLFKYADIAMYKAKDNGKNTYKFYQKDLSVTAHARLDIEQALKLALINKEITVVYQPQYLIKDKSIIGFEALARWSNHTLGSISPDKFIPIAEDTGFIIEIGLHIFEKACQDFLEFQKLSDSIQTISINISAVQLYQESFINELMAITKRVGIANSAITLEITETHIMKNIKQSMRILTSLKELGFSISIDDFGTGHSSLNYLKIFPLHELKIDKSFIDDLPEDLHDVAITKSIIALSSAMGYTNVAEGIETKEQEDFLSKNECSIGQGYYFSKPLEKEDLIKFIKNSR